MFIPRLFWGYSMTQEKIDEFADLWALMYCVMAREMVDSFGEEGKEALIRAIKNYGIARGERLKARHEEEGREINLRSLMDHYDLPGHSETEKDRVEYTDDWLKSYTYLCTHERVWRARDCNDVGLLYCQYFHHAFWQTYRPDLDVQIPDILTKDDPHCLFLVKKPKE